MVGMSVLGLAGRAVYVPPFDGEAVEGWGTQAFLPLPVMESCAEHREAARSDHTPRSGRPARSGPVRQDTLVIVGGPPSPLSFQNLVNKRVRLGPRKILHPLDLFLKSCI